MIRIALYLIAASVLTVLDFFYLAILKGMFVAPPFNNLFGHGLLEAWIIALTMLAAWVVMLFATFAAWRAVFNGVMRERFPEDVPF